MAVDPVVFREIVEGERNCLLLSELGLLARFDALGYSFVERGVFRHVNYSRLKSGASAPALSSSYSRRPSPHSNEGLPQALRYVKDEFDTHMRRDGCEECGRLYEELFQSFLES